MRSWILVPFVAISCLASAQTRIHNQLLANPSAIANTQRKLVFVSFSASWCGPCRQLHRVLEHAPVKPIWDRYFVSRSVVVDEHAEKASLNTPGGNELRHSLGGDDCGIPFFAFLKPDGTKLGDSFTQPGKSNIGCPMTPDEIEAFMSTLGKVAPKMSSAERATIRSAFEHPIPTSPSRTR